MPLDKRWGVLPPALSPWGREGSGVPSPLGEKDRMGVLRRFRISKMDFKDPRDVHAAALRRKMMKIEDRPAVAAFAS
jgi:hypothetical protein